MKYKYVFSAIFFFIIINSTYSQIAHNLNGNWSYEYSGISEGLGRFGVTVTLTIRGENYMRYADRVSEFGMHWDHCEIGRIVISENEIQLIPEALRGQMSPWRKGGTNDISRYRYILNGRDLVLMQNNNTELYRKTSELDNDQLLIYTGSMSGPQNLNIKLVVGDIGNIYYMYYRNGNYGDPINLWGNFENGVLILNEPDENYENRASMRFNNFNPNANTITGIWQDLRSGRSTNRYDLRLSK